MGPGEIVLDREGRTPPGEEQHRETPPRRSRPRGDRYPQSLVSVEAIDRAALTQARDYQRWLETEAKDETAVEIRWRLLGDGPFRDQEDLDRAAGRATFRLVHIAWLARESGLDWEGFSPYELRHAADLNYRASALRAFLRYGLEIASWPYPQYLRSSEWEDVRVFALRRAGYRCQLCNRSGRLQVHHRTYLNRGNEDLADVIVLCTDCHGRFHGLVR